MVVSVRDIIASRVKSAAKKREKRSKRGTLAFNRNTASKFFNVGSYGPPRPAKAAAPASAGVGIPKMSPEMMMMQMMVKNNQAPRIIGGGGAPAAPVVNPMDAAVQKENLQMMREEREHQRQLEFRKLDQASQAGRDTFELARLEKQSILDKGNREFIASLTNQHEITIQELRNNHDLRLQKLEQRNKDALLAVTKENNAMEDKRRQREFDLESKRLDLETTRVNNENALGEKRLTAEETKAKNEYTLSLMGNQTDEAKNKTASILAFNHLYPNDKDTEIKDKLFKMIDEVSKNSNNLEGHKYGFGIPKTDENGQTTIVEAETPEELYKYLSLELESLHEKQVAETNQQIAAANQRLDELGKAYAALETKQTNQDIDSTKKQETLNMLSKQVDQTKEELSKYRTDFISQIADIAEAKTKLSSLKGAESDIKQALARVENYDQKINDLGKQVELHHDTIGGWIDPLNRMETTFNDQISKLTSRAEALSEGIHETQNTLTNQMVASQNMTAGTIDGINNRLNTTEAQVSNLNQKTGLLGTATAQTQNAINQTYHLNRLAGLASVVASALTAKGDAYLNASADKITNDLKEFFRSQNIREPNYAFTVNKPDNELPMVHLEGKSDNGSAHLGVVGAIYSGNNFAYTYVPSATAIDLGKNSTTFDNYLGDEPHMLRVEEQMYQN